jgi:hypothetical protein
LGRPSHGMGCPKTKRRRLAVVKGVPVHARRWSYNSNKKLLFVVASDIKTSLLDAFDYGTA